MKKILLSALIITVMITGCKATTKISDKPNKVIPKVQIQAQAKPQTAVPQPENIIITDDSNDNALDKKKTVDNGIVIDAGDSKVLESTIDQITEQLER